MQGRLMQDALVLFCLASEARPSSSSANAQ